LLDSPRLYGSLAKYYDRLESQYRDYAKESEWLHSLILQEGSKRVLDLSCGTGTHASRLVKNLTDADVVAMDSSAEMATVAKNTRAGSVLQADFLHSPFPPATFDFAICMYWSLASLQDGDVALLFKEVNRLLKEGGIFVFDVENAEGIKEDLIGKPFVDAFFFDEKDGCQVSRLNYSRKTSPSEVEWKAYYILDWGTLSRLIVDKMTLRFYSKSTLESFLRRAGFSIELIASYPFGKYEAHSPSLYFVARKIQAV
jgi:ubiquinone/menaquinone biosynthesis C-methylase UbiE